MNTGKIEAVGYPALVTFNNNSKNNKENQENNKKKKQKETNDNTELEIPDEFRGKNFDVKL